MFKHELTARTEVNLNEIIQQVISVATGPMRFKWRQTGDQFD